MDPSINVLLNQSASLISTTDKTVTKRHLFQKGVSGNPAGGGRPKGSVSLKSRLNRLLTKETANQIAQELINMAIKEHNVQAIKLIAELCDDLKPNASVSITTNNTIIGSDMIEAAREFLSNREKSVSGLIINANPQNSTGSLAV